MPYGLGHTLREWQAHPAVQHEGRLGDIGCIGLHCDGVSYSSAIRAGRQKSATVLSMNIISAQDGKLRQRRHPLCVLQKGSLAGYSTYQQIFAVISWSFTCMMRGITPDCRHNGQPFSAHDLESRVPGRLVMPKAALLQVRGDWAWLAEAFRLRWYTAPAFCWQCDVTKDWACSAHPTIQNI